MLRLGFAGNCSGFLLPKSRVERVGIEDYVLSVGSIISAVLGLSIIGFEITEVFVFEKNSLM